MRKKVLNQIITILCGMIILQAILPSSGQAASPSAENANTVQEVRSLIPASVEMINNAAAVFNKGWSGMTASERAQFSTIFDPGNTGQSDQGYIETVRQNYLKIRQKLNSNFTIEYAKNNGMCVGQRLYYTDFLKMHFRPYFTNEHREERKIRSLIHETSHMTLLVVDRPYYDPKSYSSR